MDGKKIYKRNSIIIITVAVVLALAGIIAIVVLVANKNKRDKYYETIKKAESYMSEMRYEDAIAEYEKALKLNDSDAKVYENLTVLYETTGNVTKAKVVATNGYKKTRAAVLSEMVTNINIYGKTGYTINFRTIVRNVGNLKAKGSDASIKMKHLIVTQVTSYYYRDFISTLGQGTYSQDGSYSVVDFGSLKLYYPIELGSLAAIEAYSGYPDAISYKSISSVFESVDDGTSIDYQTVCDILGTNVEIVQDSNRGIYYIFTSYQGMEIKIECDSEGNITKSDPWNWFSCSNNVIIEQSTEDVVEEQDTEEENKAMMGSASGKIIDAATGRGVSGAHIKIRKGTDMHVGSTLQELDSDSSGNYKLNLKEGNYCLQVSKTGYIDQYENITIMRSVDRSGIDIVISSKLNGGVRVVLKWESQPSDLDLYVSGRTDSGSTVDVNFTNMKSYDGSGNCIAELDVDDRNGNGPETITINDVNGKYYVRVEDFTDSGTMASTNVTVTVYLPDNSSQTVTINHNLGSTNVWNVCTVDHGKLIVTNN